jgi:PAS domain S-box-containing protein
MAARVRAFDWASTPLGPPQQWPQSLRIAVGICLNSRFPMFVWWGPQLINIYNDGYIPMLGKRHPAALGKPAQPTWQDIWHIVGPQAEAVMQRGEATWNERVLLVMERHGYTEETWFTWSYSPIPDEQGGIGGLFCAVTEDTARVMAERERDRLADQKQLALNAAQMGWWHLDPRTNIARWDARYAQIFGVSGNERNYDEILKLLHPDDLPSVRAKVRAALDPQNPQSFSAEYRVNRSDGSKRWVQAHGLATFAGEGTGRKAISLVGTVADVTEQKAAEASLRESEAQFRQLADAMPQIVWSARADGTLDYYNRRWFEYIDKPKSMVNEARWDLYLHPDDLPRAYERWREAISTGCDYVIEFRVRRADGQYRWFLVRAMPIRDAAFNITRWFGTCTDIHDQKRLLAENENLLTSERLARAEAETANKAKDKFLAVLSHELRTPLSPVLLSVAAMEIDEDLPFKFREDVAMIRRNIDLETKLIDDLLDLSRVTSGKLRLVMQPVRVHDLLRHVVRSSVSDMPGKKLNLETKFDARDDRISADPARLQQVFWNLLRNAAKFTPENGRITIRTWNDPLSREFNVEVRDTGVGIDSKVLPRIFDAFEQGDSRVTRQFGGLGLGLAIAKAVVEMHGGAISASSDGAGKGAAFAVRLGKPVAGAASDDDEKPLPPGHRRRRSLVRILLVEDHPDTARTLARLLIAIGYEVRVAINTSEALKLAEAEPFDIVISDIGLPDGTGHELMRQLREKHGLRGVALTGYGMEDDMRNSREAGFLDHVVKPIDVAQLEAVIQRVVEAK